MHTRSVIRNALPKRDEISLFGRYKGVDAEKGGEGVPSVVIELFCFPEMVVAKCGKPRLP